MEGRLVQLQIPTYLSTGVKTTKKHGNLLCIYNSHKSFIKDSEEINSGFDK